MKKRPYLDVVDTILDKLCNFERKPPLRDELSGTLVVCCQNLVIAFVEMAVGRAFAGLTFRFQISRPAN